MTTRDWVSVPLNVMLDVFARLNYRDRVNLEATCTAWRSQCLWTSLDLRSFPNYSKVAFVLSARCFNLTLKVKEQSLRDLDVIKPLRHLESIETWCITWKYSKRLLNYKNLEVLELQGPCCTDEKDILRKLAPCCPKLKSLRLQGYSDYSAADIQSLGTFCPRLVNLDLDGCRRVDEDALASLPSLKYLSIKTKYSGSINWEKAAEAWKRFVAINISHTDAQLKHIKHLLKSPHLKVLCAFSACKDHVTRTQAWCNISGGSTFLLPLSTNDFERLPFTYTSDPELFDWTKRAILNSIDDNTRQKDYDEEYEEKQETLLKVLMRTESGITHEDVLERSYRPLDPEVLLELAGSYNCEDHIRLRAANTILDCADTIRSDLADRAANAFLNLARSRRKTLMRTGICGLLRCPLEVLVHSGAVEVFTDLAMKGIPEAISALVSQARTRVFAQRLYDSGGIRALTQLESLKGGGVLVNVVDVRLWDFLDVCRPQFTISVGKDGAVVLHLDGETYHGAAGTLCCFALVPEQLKAIVEQGGVHFLLKSLRTSQDEATKFEAALILAAVMCQTSDLQMLKLITPSIFSYQTQLTSKAGRKVRDKLRLKVSRENGWQVLLEMLRNGPPDVHALVLVAAQIAFDDTELCDLGADEVMKQVESSSFFHARKMAKVMCRHGKIFKSW